MELQTNVKTGDVKIADTTQNIQTTSTQVVKEPDLITRVSSFEPEKTDVKPTGDIKEPEFDFKDIEAIKDPVARDLALKAYKSFQKGFGQKFQELAETRKMLEASKKSEENWSPDRVQALLQNKDFVNAAQSIIGPQSNVNEETYELTEKEKELMKTVKQHEAELTEIKRMNLQSMIANQDVGLKNKYANYNAQAVDTLTADLLAGKVQATREHLWRVYDYEDAVQRAYELGKKDGSGIKQEKIQSTSVEGLTTVRSDNQVQAEKGESNRDFFRRLFENNLSKAKTEQIRK